MERNVSSPKILSLGSGLTWSNCITLGLWSWNRKNTVDDYGSSSGDRSGGDEGCSGISCTVILAFLLNATSLLVFCLYNVVVCQNTCYV